MITKFKIAAAQMNTQDNLSENLNIMERLVDDAAAEGAKFIAFPEYANYIGRGFEDYAERIPGGGTFQLLSGLAKKHQIYIHSGSSFEREDGEPRPYNTSFIVGPDGSLLGKYKKIHPFDVVIEGGPDFKESDRIASGSEVVTIKTKIGTIGLSICYDLRFPEIFRKMALSGAEILVVPSSFAVSTADCHWEPLLKARAIENACYVVAPAQYGVKPRFEAYGDSRIIDPWGRTISSMVDPKSTGITMAEIDLGYIKSVRNQIFTLRNRRPEVY